MTNADEFNHRECDKIDSNCINAYVDFKIDPDNVAGICLDTSWGGDCLDLTGVVKAAETVTSLELSPEEDPNCLVFNREDGQADCITGDELSRIISLSKLKDVDQDTAPVNGDVLIYNNGKWYTFNLQTYMDNVATLISNLTSRVTTIEGTLAPIANRFQLFTNVPSNAKIMLGNINLYSDDGAVIDSNGVVQSLDKSNGIYGHSLSTDRAQDEIFG